MSGEAPDAPRPEGGSGQWARTLHAALASLATLALAVLFAWNWSRGLALWNPLPAILIALSLAVGDACARAIAVRLERVRGIAAVTELLRIAGDAGAEQQDGMEEPRGPSRSRLMLIVMSLQIVLTGAAGLAMLLVLRPLSGYVFRAGRLAGRGFDRIARDHVRCLAGRGDGGCR